MYIKNELKEENIAQNLIRNITERTHLLKYFPFAYKLLKKTKSLEYRKFIFKNYIIIYKINLKEKEISLLHIYNQKRNIKFKSK